MSVLDRAKQHFNDRMSESMECVEVPEWGDENGPAKIWYRPAINLREQNQIGGLASAGKNDEALAMSVILRARNEDGTMMFNKNNLMEFRTFVDPEVIARIVMEMNADEFELSDEEIEKN
jgi:hypothetical protein|tara:strand:- start:288 stop:647 length:360 start_codon:yes stop_codon:yes gene_type:complete